MSVVDDSYDQPLRLEEHAAMPLAGGIAAMGYQCGQVWGAALAAGAQAHRLWGPGPRAESATVAAAQRLVQSFSGSYRSVDCRDVTGLDWNNLHAGQIISYILTGKIVRCFAMAGAYAQAARRELDAIYARGAPPAATSPVSCAAVLAQAMGASAMHQVMVAGFAGGIGLSGGACGALGAAVWLIALSDATARGKVDWTSPRYTQVKSALLQHGAGKLECSAITGRRFSDPSDHAEFLHSGGCAEIIAALAAQPN
jgi:hypothetical protein